MVATHLLATALLFATASFAQYCPNPVEYDGNYYYAQVDAITYTGVGGTGAYDKITNMDSNTGQCSSSPYGYSGSLSPLNEEVSLHVRGPARLMQFAAYTPGEPSTKKAKRKEQRRIRRHAHQHAHKRQVGATVTATIDGQVDTWINEYNGSPGPALIAASSATNTPTPPESSSQPSSAAGPVESSSPSSPSGGFGSWGRQGFYDASQATADGIVFLNHFGGIGSGVFDYSFGNSLSYASSNGTTGASSPQILQDTILPSGAEVVIMTDSECGGNNGGCGYYRPGTVAYHGFDGCDKAFFFEFEMPNDGQTTTNIYDPVNMPSVWMLNAQIPRTLQYGNPECSCWESGCGEFDIFEVLSPGYDKAKSTVHGNVAGGSSDWFERPENCSIKVGVVMVDDNIHVKILDDGMEFGSTQAAGVIQGIVESTMTESRTVALYSLQGGSSG